jgi:putative membrane protein (TIGR04086 family)
MARSERRPRRSFQEPAHTDHVILYIAKGSAVSLVVSVLFSVFLAIVSLVTDLAGVERYMPFIILGATICSVFVGSVYAAQQAKSRGLLIGAGVGVVYVLVAAMFDMHISTETITLIVFCKKMAITTVTGAIGGTAGANM